MVAQSGKNCEEKLYSYQQSVRAHENDLTQTLGLQTIGCFFRVHRQSELSTILTLYFCDAQSHVAPSRIHLQE
jgi:hypothetical protein